MAIFWALLFGAVGSGYLLYAKRQYDGVFALSGFALCIFPYFVDSWWATLLVGCVLMAVPFAVRQYNG